MRGIKCIFVEKKDGFNIEANSLLEDFKNTKNQELYFDNFNIDENDEII